MMSIILRTLVDTIRQFFVRHAKYLILDEICAYKIRRRLVVRGALTNFQRNTIKNTARFYMHSVEITEICHHTRYLDKLENGEAKPHANSLKYNEFENISSN